MCRIAHAERVVLRRAAVPGGPTVRGLQAASPEEVTMPGAAARSLCHISFLLALSGYGDADMINYFTPAGERIPPRAARRIPPGPAILALPWATVSQPCSRAAFTASFPISGRPRAVKSG